MNKVSSSEHDIRLETGAGGEVASIVLDRGPKRNSLSPTMLARMLGFIRSACEGNERIIVLRSAVDGIFCAGFDIGFIGTDQEQTGASLLYQCFAALENAEKITVAVADGLVVGGGVELFLSCDLRLATPRASFRLPPARLSVVYSYAGLARFVRTIGPTAAMEMFVSGRTFSAEEAQQSGLVTRTVPCAEAADEYCSEMLRGAPLAQQAMKAMIRHIAAGVVSGEADPAAAVRFAAMAEAVSGSDDRQEAQRAFIEKRLPAFTGR